MARSTVSSSGSHVSRDRGDAMVQEGKARLPGSREQLEPPSLFPAQCSPTLSDGGTSPPVAFGPQLFSEGDL